VSEQVTQHYSHLGWWVIFPRISQRIIVRKPSAHTSCVCGWDDTIIFCKLIFSECAGQITMSTNSEPIILQSLQIKNFKRFPDLTINLGVLDSPLLICGENGSGKTQVLWALLLFFRACNSRSQRDAPRD
jgi:hypothetical protein